MIWSKTLVSAIFMYHKCIICVLLIFLARSSCVAMITKRLSASLLIMSSTFLAVSASSSFVGSSSKSMGDAPPAPPDGCFWVPSPPRNRWTSWTRSWERIVRSSSGMWITSRTSFCVLTLENPTGRRSPLWMSFLSVLPVFLLYQLLFLKRL